MVSTEFNLTISSPEHVYTFYWHDMQYDPLKPIEFFTVVESCIMKLGKNQIWNSVDVEHSDWSGCEKN